MEVGKGGGCDGGQKQGEEEKWKMRRKRRRDGSVDRVCTPKRSCAEEEMKEGKGGKKRRRGKEIK